VAPAAGPSLYPSRSSSSRNSSRRSETQRPVVPSFLAISRGEYSSELGITISLTIATPRSERRDQLTSAGVVGVEADELDPRSLVDAVGEDPTQLFHAVTTLVAREDRTPDRRVFQGFGGDRFRTAVTRACTAAGVPAFSPHDLRHRRISLLHLTGVPWAPIGEHVGQRSLRVTADTYSHVLIDERELDHAALLP
jgi:hypothetical protein